MTQVANVTPEICVIIPAKDEIVALPGLIEEIAAALADRSHAITVVDDGSVDGTPALLSALAVRYPQMRWLRNEISIGQSGSIRRGVKATNAPLIVTLDGDGQNPPDQIPLLLARMECDTSGRLGLVQGQRLGRRDTAARRSASRIANAIRNGLLHDGVRDSGCGMKVFRREAYLDLPFFDHIHRFMAAMMRREGWEVAVVEVTHRSRHGGRSKYSNLARALVGIPDLLGAAWLIRRSSRPLERVETATEVGQSSIAT